MACPQPDQFTKFSNEYLDALCRAPWLPYHVRCLLFIARQTWGHHETWAEIRNRDFAEATGIDKSHICRAIRQLVGAKAIVAQSGNKRALSYRIQKDYDIWEPLPEQYEGCLIRQQNVVTLGNKTLPNQATPPIKEIKERKIAAEFSADPPPETSEKEKKSTPKAKKKLTDWPPDFALKKGMHEYAVAQGYALDKIDDLFESWRLACESRGYQYKNWLSAYQKMCRDDWDAHKKYKAPVKKRYEWQAAGD
jgi:phage replication O-like protein O